MSKPSHYFEPAYFDSPDPQGHGEHNLRSAIQFAVSVGFEPQHILEIFFDELKAERIERDRKN